MRSAILPFWPVIRDFIKNLWRLRLFFLTIFITLLMSSAILFIAEGKNIDPGLTGFYLWEKTVGITFNDAFFGLSVRYSPVTFFGKATGIVNSLLGFILLGMLIWVVEQSLTDQDLKKSKFMFFPSKEDFIEK